MASVSATLRRQARAIPVATCATSSAWLSRGALVVGGEDEDLGLARQPPEGRRVQDAVPVPLEAGAPRVGLLGDGAPAPGRGPGRPRGEHQVLGRFARRAPEGLYLGAGSEAGGGVGMRRAQALVTVPGHGGGPAPTPLGRRDRGWLHGP